MERAKKMDKLVSLQVERETSEDKKKYMYIHETILHISKGILGKKILPSLSISRNKKRKGENYRKQFRKIGSLWKARILENG